MIKDKYDIVFNTYPAFPQEIWILMTQAKGKNGTGAGTIFWKFWNRKWLPSQLRKYVKSELAKKVNIMVHKIQM